MTIRNTAATKHKNSWRFAFPTNRGTTMKKLLSFTTLAGLMMAGAASAETNFIANSFYDGAVPMSGEGYIRWAELVQELSEGDLVPEVYTGTVLLAPRASLQGIQDNVVQVAHHAAIYTPSDLPVANAVQELGFAYSDPVAAIFAVTDFSMNNEVQLQEWQDKGLVYLGAYATPAYVLMCSSPVRTLEEMKGKRIRTAGSAVSVWVEEAGGIPVNVPSSEMYTGLERGTLDCATNAASDLVDRSLLEVAEHTTLLSTGMYWSGPQWGYNPDFWAGLTPEQREVLMEASARSMARMVIAYNEKVEAGLQASRPKYTSATLSRRPWTRSGRWPETLTATVTGIRESPKAILRTACHRTKSDASATSP